MYSRLLTFCVRVVLLALECLYGHESLLLLAHEWSVRILDIVTLLVHESPVCSWIVIWAQDAKWLGFMNWDRGSVIMRFGTSWKFLNKSGVKVIILIQLLLIFLLFDFIGLRLYLAYSTTLLPVCFILKIVVTSISLQALFCTPYHA